MARYVADSEGHWVLVEKSTSEGHFVMNDLDFRSPDGKHIGSRSQWREHLKRTNTVEMGHADMKAAQERHMSQQSDIRENEKQAAKLGIKTEFAEHKGEIREADRSRLQREVLNRLDGRPVPSLQESIKITLETARDLARRR